MFGVCKALGVEVNPMFVVALKGLARVILFFNIFLC